jgi:hypothetical protein
MMNISAYLAHSSDGRIRIKVPSMRNDFDYFQQATDTLGTVAGVTTVRTNPRTASILVLHDDLTMDALSKYAMDADLFELQTISVESDIISLETIQALSAQALTIGGTFSKSMFFYLLMGLAIRQAMKGQLMAPAISLFWYAFEILEQANNNK